MPEVSMPPEAAAMPDPGEVLIARVAGGPDRASFFWSGRESVRELERTLAIAGRSLDSFESILDFGCGCGRMLLWMEQLGRARALHGTDIDAEAIEWCRTHIPYARVTVNDADPPLPYPDGAFDLVFNHSVFTHIDARRQDSWLAELQRITRPGALLVLSTHGESALPDVWAIRDQVEQDGIAFVDHTAPTGNGLPDWYQTTWHAPWYVFEHWARWFQIRAVVPCGDLDFQDQWLLERRPDGPPPRPPLAARRAPPREGTPASRLAAAREQARTYRGGDATVRSPTGAIRRLARELVLRLIRPYTAHQDNVDDAVAMSIAELTRAADDHEARLVKLESPSRKDS